MKRRLMRLGYCVCILLIVAYIFLSPRFSPELYTAKLFRPAWGKGSMRALRSFNKYENHEIYFSNTQGGKLHGWMFFNPTSKKMVLFHHGNAGDIAKRLTLVEALLDSGASVFIYEPRGFGMSPGEPSIESFTDDGVTAYDFLISKGYKPQDIVLYGESLGCAAATYVSTQRTASGIILQSGFQSLERIAKEQVPALRGYPSFLFPERSLNNAEIMSRPHPPLLILHGDRDALIPVNHAEETYRLAAEPKTFVRFPQSGHSNVTKKDLTLYTHAVWYFLNSLP